MKISSMNQLCFVLLLAACSGPLSVQRKIVSSQDARTNTGPVAAGTAGAGNAQAGGTRDGTVTVIPNQSTVKKNSQHIQRFLELYDDMHASNNGYFSQQGIPYHSIETLIVEAPDYGHETTSEAFSYWLLLEAQHGRVTGNWNGLTGAWNSLETYMIPSREDQPSNAGYNPSHPATYAGEWEQPNQYPSRLETDIPVGRDPIAAELKSTYGDEIYGMHWLLDVDNWYGYGKRGDGISTPSLINTFQRGEQESVWETVPHPSFELFKWGGTFGFLNLFTGDNSYSKQWRYTNAPDADARAVEAIFWANHWAGENPTVSALVGKATKMGDFLRYAMFDKYFKPIGTESKQTAGGTGYEAAHYLMSWYYAWGGSETSQNGWAWRIGSSHTHFGYQNPLTAWILATQSDFAPRSANGARDWAQSLDRQIEFYTWLQSSEGGIAGGATNSVKGRYEAHPPGAATFHGMVYDEDPVYHDPASNRWFGFQTWSMQRLAQYFYATGDARAKDILGKWVTWALTGLRLSADGGFEVPSTLAWSGQPSSWTGQAGHSNPALHVQVIEWSQDIGVAASLARTFMAYSAGAARHGGSNGESAKAAAGEILERMWTKYRDDKGISSVEKRDDYLRFFDPVYVPSGFQGRMANGDIIDSSSTFLSLRSKYRSDPDFARVQSAIAAKTAPEFRYHRFWAQAEAAVAYAEYEMLME